MITKTSQKTARVGILLPQAEEQTTKRKNQCQPLFCERKSSESCRVLLFSSLLFSSFPSFPPSSTEDFLYYHAFSSLGASGDYIHYMTYARAILLAFVASHTQVHRSAGRFRIFLSIVFLSCRYARFWKACLTTYSSRVQDPPE
jgi:hypothetical protein